MSVSTRSSVDGHRIILFYSHKLPVGYTLSMYTPYTIFIYLYGAPFSTKKYPCLIKNLLKTWGASYNRVFACNKI